MNYFLVFFVIFYANIFASGIGESWEYKIKNERFIGERIVATRTTADGAQTNFIIEAGEHWTYKNFFESPKVPCERHLVGIFSLKGIVDGFFSEVQIPDHKMHLRISWFYNDRQQLVCGALESLGYATAPISINEIKS